MPQIRSIPFDPVLGQREVARIMGVSVDTVRRRCAAGDLRIIRLSPRRLGIRSSEVDRYLREREGLPPQHDGGQRDAPADENSKRLQRGGDRLVVERVGDARRLEGAGDAGAAHLLRRPGVAGPEHEREAP